MLLLALGLVSVGLSLPLALGWCTSAKLQMMAYALHLQFPTYERLHVGHD